MEFEILGKGANRKEDKFDDKAKSGQKTTKKRNYKETEEIDSN